MQKLQSPVTHNKGNRVRPCGPVYVERERVEGVFAWQGEGQGDPLFATTPYETVYIHGMNLLPSLQNPVRKSASILLIVLENQAADTSDAAIAL